MKWRTKKKKKQEENCKIDVTWQDPRPSGPSLASAPRGCWHVKSAASRMKPVRTWPLSSYLGTSITWLNSSQDQTQNFASCSAISTHRRANKKDLRRKAPGRNQGSASRIPIQNASRELKSPAKGYERRCGVKTRNWITAREPTPCRATLAAARGRGGFRRRLRRAARDRCASGERGNGGGAAQVSRPRWEADAEAEGEQTEEQVVGGRSLSTTTGS